jgi:glycosyltransferase involved in cell wall biosynthesis
MVDSIFITADDISSNSGGGTVSRKESEFLQRFSKSTYIIDRSVIGTSNDPFELDERALNLVATHIDKTNASARLAHLYAGAFPRTVAKLKEYGIRVSYTAAAHDLEESKKEFYNNGHDYAALFPHMIDDLDNYLYGYVSADMVICPSQISKNVMHNFGCGRVTVIPHGIEKLHNIVNNKKFTLGYLGQTGPDKGIKYLLEAWGRANIKDGLLVVAGRGSESLWHSCQGGNINLLGYVNDIHDFYKQLTVYCQPSVTEGFGIEVLEAQSYGIPVICSQGVGAVDCVPNELTFMRRDVSKLTELILKMKTLQVDRELTRNNMKQYLWPVIETKYIDTWSKMLCS